MTRDLTEALRSLIGDDGKAQLLPAAPTRGAKPKVTSSGRNPGSTGGGGISGTLTETAYSDREYYSAGYKTTDGLFTLPSIKTVQMTDSAGNAVLLNFAEPSA